MRYRISSTLTTWPFVCALLLLLLNDGWLKYAHPGLISGKVSDFAGIAMVGLLLLAVWPDRPLLVYAACAVAFTWWKSPWSEPCIAFVNAHAPVRFGRTVDYTDLVALLVLPMCGHVVARREHFAIPWCRLRRFLIVPVVAATVFGTAATSMMPTHVDYADQSFAPDEVHEVIVDLAARHGLACDACPLSDGSMVFRGGGLKMTYRFSRGSVVVFAFDPSTGEKAEALRVTLKESLAKRFKPLTYVEGASPPDYCPE